MLKKCFKLNYIFAAISIIIGVLNIVGKINIYSVIGALYLFLTAFLLIKKPKVGYILLILVVVLIGVMVAINKYLASY